jgi:hypothetical protein
MRNSYGDTGPLYTNAINYNPARMHFLCSYEISTEIRFPCTHMLLNTKIGVPKAKIGFHYMVSKERSIVPDVFVNRSLKATSYAKNTWPLSIQIGPMLPLDPMGFNGAQSIFWLIFVSGMKCTS